MQHKFLERVSAAAEETIAEITKLSFGLLDVLS